MGDFAGLVLTRIVFKCGIIVLGSFGCLSLVLTRIVFKCSYYVVIFDSGSVWY